MGRIPSQCPECGAIAVTAHQVPPDQHERGEEWRTRVECTECSDYTEWLTENAR